MNRSIVPVARRTDRTIVRAPTDINSPRGPAAVPQTVSDQPIYPPGRYGRRRDPRPPRRGRTVVVAVAGGLVGLLLALVMFDRYHARYQPRVLDYQLGDRSATVRFDVTHQGERELVCHLRS